MPVRDDDDDASHGELTRRIEVLEREASTLRERVNTYSGATREIEGRMLALEKLPDEVVLLRIAFEALRSRVVLAGTIVTLVGPAITSLLVWAITRSPH